MEIYIIIGIVIGVVVLIAVVVAAILHSKSKKVEEKEDTYYLKSNVRYLRLKKELSIEQISSMLKISIEMWKSIENGASIEFSRIAKIAEFFKVPTVELVFRDFVKSRDIEWYGSVINK